MKKIVALMLALVLCLSMAVTAFAIPARPHQEDIDLALSELWNSMLMYYAGSDIFPEYSIINSTEAPAPTMTAYTGGGLLVNNLAVNASPVLMAQAVNVHSGEEYMNPGESYEMFWFDMSLLGAQPHPFGFDSFFYPTQETINILTGLAGVPFPSPFDTSEYRVSADWEIGGALVSKIYLDDADDNNPFTGSLIIDLMENYTIDELKDLQGVITFEAKGSNGIDLEFVIDGAVSNSLVVVDGYSKIADSKDDAIEAEDNTIYWCEDQPGYVTFNTGTRLLSTTLKMVKDEKAFMYNNEEMIDAVEEMYSDLDADIECYQFGGSPTFQNEAMFSLQADYADQYFVYEWNGKTLTKVDYEWDSINGIYTWATKSPTDYVISDKELVAGAQTETDPEDKNPDTGMSHVGGIAVGAVVMAMVGLAAVSIKRK